MTLFDLFTKPGFLHIKNAAWKYDPDLVRTKLFIMNETTEDRHINSIKITLVDLKRNGGKFIAINPVRSGYAGIADEWVPIKPCD